MRDDPFRRLGLSSDASAAAIKKAYRKLCLQCHPDVRPDKDQAQKEFLELTRIYELALSMIGKVQPPPRPKPPPKEPPPRPDRPLVHLATVPNFDQFEFMLFGEAFRVATAPPELFEYGGTLIIRLIDIGSGAEDGRFSFQVPPLTKSGQKFRLQMSIGKVEFTLVKEG